MPTRRNVRNASYNRYRGYAPYVYGSTARAYSVKREVRREKPQGPKVVRLVEGGAMHRVAIICIAVFSAMLMICFLCLYGYNYKISTEISELQESLDELKEDNYYLESDFDNNLNLEYIEKIAVEKLGMQKPSSYQIRYINVPKQSYTILYDETHSEKGFFDYLKELDFRSAIGSLFN